MIQFNPQLITDAQGASYIEKLVLDAIKNPAKAKKIQRLLESAAKRSVGQTAGRTRKLLKLRLKTNEYVFRPNTIYTLTGEEIGAVIKRWQPGSDAPSKRRSIRKRGRFWGKLGNVILYRQYGRKKDQAAIGIVPGYKGTSRKAEEYARALEKGGTRDVTPRMRRYFAAIGIPLRASTSVLVNKPRPLISLTYDKEKTGMVKNLESGFLKRLLRG